PVAPAPGGAPLVRDARGPRRSGHPHPVAGGGLGGDVAQPAAGVEVQLELVEAAEPVAVQVRRQVGVLAAHRVAQRGDDLLAGHAGRDLRLAHRLLDLGRPARDRDRRILGHDVAAGEAGVVQVAAVVVADLLAFAVDLHLDPVAAVAGDFRRSAGGDDALAALGVVAVADPAAVAAHVAAQEAVV